MKKNDGITLSALIITIVVMIILAGVSINVTTDMQEQMRFQAFKTKLDILQTEVIQNYDNAEIVTEEMKTEDTFVTYTSNQLEQMGFTKTDQDAYINWKTRQVKMIYNGTEYTSEKYNVESNISNESNTDFDLQLEYTNNRYKVTVQPKENKAGLEVAYRAKAEEGQAENNWIIVNGLGFEYIGLDTCEVKLKDKNENETIKTINTTDFYVQDGLMLQLDGIRNTEGGYDSDTTTWYDLSGNGMNGTINGATWNENGLYFDGIDDWVAIGEMNYDAVTIEAVIMHNNVEKDGEQCIVVNFESGGYGLSYYRT